jgi:hypothetical protein
MQLILRILVSFFLVILYLKANCQTERFVIYSETEKILKITDRFKKLRDSKKSPHFIINGKIQIPYYDKSHDSFYAYINKGLNYLCSDQQIDNSVAKWILSNSEFEIFDDQNYHKYSIPTNDSIYWFYDFLTEGEEKGYTFRVGINLNSQIKENSKIALFNFANHPTMVLISAGDIKKEITLYKQGIQYVNIAYKSSTANIKINVSPINGDIGIVKFQFPILDRKFDESKTFSINKFSTNQTLKIVNDDFLFFNANEGHLNKMLFDRPYNHFIAQKKTEIRELDVNDMQRINQGFVISCDYLIVYHKLFQNNIQSLESVIKILHPNYRIKSIDVESIYTDYGYKDANAIKEFIHKVKPKYVVLVGDANSKKEARNNLIPTFFHIQQKEYSQIPTDFPFSFDKNPSNPEIGVGRIPVQNNDELLKYIEKIQSHIKLKTRIRKGFVYDVLNLIEDGSKFDKSCIIQQGSIEQTYIESILSIIQGVPIINTINELSPRTVVYLGHGSFTGWNINKKVTWSDFKYLAQNKTFILFDLSCWTGEYANVDKYSFDENLILLENRGPISALCASGYTSLTSYDRMVKFILSHQNLPIGELNNKMKETLFSKGEMEFDDLFAFNILGIPSFDAF